MAALTNHIEQEMTFAQLSAEADKGSRGIVARRDEMRCVKCGSKGVQVHEIAPRSHFGRKTLHICFHPKNRCLLCVPCHERAHTFKRRVELIRLMGNKYGYEYPEDQFRRYI